MGGPVPRESDIKKNTIQRISSMFFKVSPEFRIGFISIPL